MGKWFPKVYDCFMSPLEKRPHFKQLRKRIVEQASGNVLEIGAGTGVNFNLYTSRVQQVIASDPNPEMVSKARLKRGTSSIPIHLEVADAEALPFSNHSFDTVVATLVFCSIPHPEIALKEVLRVLKPHGKFLLFEHVKMDNPILSKTQDALTPIWKQLCDGCHLNRDTLQLIKKASFHILHVDSVYNGLFISIEAQKKD